MPRKQLFIDSGEMKSGIPDLFKIWGEKNDVKIVIIKLKIGDYHYIEIDDEDNIIKEIIIERKNLVDLLESIGDERITNQFENMIDFMNISDKNRAFLVIIGDSWKNTAIEYNSHKENPRNIESYFASIDTIITNFSVNNLPAIQVPDTKRFVDCCIKLFNKEYENVLKHRITIDHSNADKDNFTRSVKALTDGLGIKTAEKITKHFKCYEDIINSSPIIISNLVRIDSDKKESNKPMKAIEHFWNDCKGIKNEGENNANNNSEYS